MILLDTNIVSEVWRHGPDPQVEAWFEKQDPAELFICLPVIAELSYGANRALLRDKSIRYIDALTTTIHHHYRRKVLASDLAASLKFGEIVAERESRGRPIGPLDAMIAAICLVNGATLATRNVRDFDGLNLKLVNPFEPAA
ncbi:MAG: type II toxin-antitoxin system VapC family toxin [Rhizobiaceae bacterium]